MWPSGSVRQNTYPIPLHEEVSLTHGYREFAHAQGGVTLGPEKGELDAEFLKVRRGRQKMVATSHERSTRLCHILFTRFNPLVNIITFHPEQY
jgi:hypothetical protein